MFPRPHFENYCFRESPTYHKNKIKLNPENLKNKYFIFPFGFVKKIFENVVTKWVLRENKLQLGLVPSLEETGDPRIQRGQECEIYARGQEY